MYYNDPYTELYHYGVPGMKWGVRKAIPRLKIRHIVRSAKRAYSNRSFQPLDPSDGRRDWGSHVRSQAGEIYRQGRRAVGSAYNRAKSAAGNMYDKAKDTYDKASSAVNAGFKAAGLERYQSAILIGGGIALAGAATAGGIALYKHHKKKQASKNKNKD